MARAPSRGRREDSLVARLLRGRPPLRAPCERWRASEELAGDRGKVVTTAKSADDNITDPDALRGRAQGRYRVLHGGARDVSRAWSRMRLGRPLAYASLPDEPVAPGQLPDLDHRTLRRMVGVRR